MKITNQIVIDAMGKSTILFLQWEAFSLPELQNFLRILEKEEDEQLQTLKRRYEVYRKKLEEALGGLWIPS